MSSPFRAPGDPVQVADQLHSAAIHLLRRVRRQDEATGLGPAALSALSVLVFAGPQTLGELAAAEQVKPPTMSRLVAGLVRGGLVRRAADARDRRLVRLEATRKGIRLLQQGHRRRVRVLAERLRGLPLAERKLLARAAGLLESLFARQTESRR